MNNFSSIYPSSSNSNPKLNPIIKAIIMLCAFIMVVVVFFILFKIEANTISYVFNIPYEQLVSNGYFVIPSLVVNIIAMWGVIEPLTFEN